MSAELYKFVIDPAKLDSGEQDARAFVKATDGKYHEFPLGHYYIPFQSNTASSSGQEGSDMTADAEDLTQTAASDADVIETNDAAGEVVDEQIPPTTTSEVVPTGTNPVTKLIAPSGDYKGFVLVKFSVLPTTFTGNIVVYIRDPRSTTRKFVGSAERYQDYWRFYFDTKQVPNGDYELFSVAIPQGQRKEYRSENSSKIRIANFVETEIHDEEDVANKIDSPALVEANAITKTSTEQVVVEQSGRSLPDFTIIDAENEEENGEVLPVSTEVSTVLKPHEAKIRELLNRYAVAIQSGDELLLIVEQVLSDRTINFLADEVEQVLEERFAALEKRVETFEELRKTASNSESSIDTDQDGISDIDEKTLYNTDPNMPDSDNDGINDGVEIMRGFNPVDPAAEAVIEYEMPQESPGLIENEILKVEAVTPIIKTLSDDGGKEVHAEISGTALPNSYVTLYIFSTPTIVTVRTDEKGLFSYSFDKELEDGEHEVYVAITDNTGAIMARSNPFKFVKEAEAFTPVDTSISDLASPQSSDTLTMMNSYNTVAGLGILAFGLILLMLGISMREKKDGVEMTAPIHDLKAT
jgi:hypothetical protein